MEEAIDRTDDGQVAVRDLLDAFGSRALGPIALLCGLIVILPPIGMIPGVPAVVGLFLLLFSVQFIFGKKRIWLPGFVSKRSFEHDKLEKARDKSIKWLSRLDSLFKPRLKSLTNGVMERVAAVIISILALTMIPLELVPGAVAVPGWAVLFFGVALMAKDGLFMLFALTASLGTFYLLGFVLPGAL